MRRRVVVTGLGLVSPLGCTVKSAWNKLLSGASGVCKLGEEFDQFPCRIGALIPKGTGPDEFNERDYATKSEMRSMSAATLYGLVAAMKALEDSAWTPKDLLSKKKTGVCIGMGMVDVDYICQTGETLAKSYSRISPFFVPRILPNMAAGYVSMKFGFQGPNHCVSTACATGCHAIGDAMRFIRNGDADVMIAGGTEASVSPLAVGGFCKMRALCTSFNDCPEKSSRPFDVKRDGFVMGEGAAVLVLEDLNHALQRKATIYAEILGYGLSGDATHITAPHEEGAGALLAMERALSDSQVSLGDVTYVNAHATSTTLGDAIELKSIKTLFSQNMSNICVSSTKGAHGHLLGAAGSLESLFTVLACHQGMIPPTINLEEVCEEGKDINCVPNKPLKWTTNRRVALKNSFGFGGTNACLCIGQFHS